MDKALERLVWSRANDSCEYCKLSQAFDPLAFQIDHIIAVQHSGETVEANLALACYSCNCHKGPNIAGLDRPTNQVVRLFSPRTDVWSEHFAWRGAELLGLTPCGRVTVHVLAVNNEFRVALRRALIDEGVFP
jgi:hypothetical protein